MNNLDINYKLSFNFKVRIITEYHLLRFIDRKFDRDGNTFFMNLENLLENIIKTDKQLPIDTKLKIEETEDEYISISIEENENLKLSFNSIGELTEVILDGSENLRYCKEYKKD